MITPEFLGSVADDLQKLQDDEIQPCDVDFSVQDIIDELVDFEGVENLDYITFIEHVVKSLSEFESDVLHPSGIDVSVQDQIDLLIQRKYAIIKDELMFWVWEQNNFSFDDACDYNRLLDFIVAIMDISVWSSEEKIINGTIDSVKRWWDNER